MIRIHCSMDELLAIRSGEGTPAATEHLNDCQDCTDELERLHQRVAALKALPTMKSPRDRWSVVRDHVVRERRSRRRWVTGWVSVATAASIALVMGVAQMLPGTPGAVDEQDPYTVLVEQSQSLDEMLRSLQPDTRVLNGRAASAIAVIEDRLSALDVRLAEAELQRDTMNDLMWLMRERVGLMDALVEVHRTKGTYVGF